MVQFFPFLSNTVYIIFFFIININIKNSFYPNFFREGSQISYSLGWKQVRVWPLELLFKQSLLFLCLTDISNDSPA